MEAHNGRSVFIKHARNIGRAYRSQAIELISICLTLSRVAPHFAHEDGELMSVLRTCDLALNDAADSGREVNNRANKRFEKATRVLCMYFERWRRRFLSPGMPILPKGGSYTVRLSCSNCALLIGPSSTLILQRTEDQWRPKMMINRYKDRARITLEQNPHFYSSLPADESAYTPIFKRRPLGDLSLALKPHDIVYVLVDRPGRVFLETKGEKRRFGNVWMLNGTLIFKGLRRLSFSSIAI
ncbi:hypothetical protein EDB92DRAFT_1844912 [Lactarius akahatsu]|uniref:Uncharacterized protein n=1 Tax=Lactarius akahatsu TaxID=416441 RepID=A0AAD4LKU6_9AGAM|nr:hypothetical protein EDB92DRAFT_1844912 [Lactarius akahatsu]